MNYNQLYIPVAAAYGCVLLLRLLKIKSLARIALLAAFLLQAGFLAARSLSFGFFNSGGILEEQVFLPFSLAGIGLWLWSSCRDEEASAVSAVAAVFALLVLPINQGVLPPSPKSVSLLVPVFFFCEIVAHALFIAAATLAARATKGVASFTQAHRFAVWGFVFFSAAQVSGAAWCYQGWSVPFQWSFRHLHSAAIWCFFANYIHLRFMPWWTDRRKAVFLAVGALLLVAYLAALQLIEAGQLRIGG
jgi:ABC-type transport system involved in cytochrome c biogenesis permease subunit